MEQSRYEGSLDIINNEFIHGWCWNLGNQIEIIKIDIYTSDVLIATVNANLYRKDLYELKKGDGFHAFTCLVPEDLKKNKEITIHAKIHNSDIELGNSPQKHILSEVQQNITPLKQRLNSIEEYGEELASMQDAPFWKIEDIKIIDEQIEISGWAIAPKDDYDMASFTINDKEFDEITYPTERIDIGKALWYLNSAKKCGFRCVKMIDKDEILKQNHIVFKHINKITRQSFYHHYNLHYPVAENNKINLPDSKRIERVHGSGNKDTFIITGYSIYQNIKGILNSYFSRDFDDFTNVLDWGCGCGRVTRYLNNLSDSMQITGIDIDKDNIEWCKENLKFGDFKSIPLNPPTEISGSAFDLVIGISIFTHLKEDIQFKWLEELKRITTKGAILLVTVHNSNAICRLNWKQFKTFDIWRNMGFVDSGENTQLEGFIEDNANYSDDKKTVL